MIWKYDKDWESVTTIADECMRVGLEIGTSDILGNEVSENRNDRLSYIG